MHTSHFRMEALRAKRPGTTIGSSSSSHDRVCEHPANDLRMPAIDALASRGVLLERHYVNMACTPTRSSLLTSRYQIHTGLQHGVIGECQPSALPLDAGPTIAEAFKAIGFATAMYGKWHLGHHREEFTPWRRGFDEFVGFLQSAEDHNNHTIHDFCPADAKEGPGWACGAHTGRKCLRETNCSFGLDLRRYPPVNASWGTADLSAERDEYSTNLYSRLAVARLEAHAAAGATVPGLFLYYAPNAVHIPLQV